MMFRDTISFDIAVMLSMHKLLPSLIVEDFCERNKLAKEYYSLILKGSRAMMCSSGRQSVERARCVRIHLRVKMIEQI